MTKREAEKLRVGDKVIWESDPADHGKIVEVGYMAIKILWVLTAPATSIIHLNDMESVSRAPAA